jgi:hypothetical protein
MQLTEQNILKGFLIFMKLQDWQLNGLKTGIKRTQIGTGYLDHPFRKEIKSGHLHGISLPQGHQR